MTRWTVEPVDRTTFAGSSSFSRDALEPFSADVTALVAAGWRHECGAKPRAAHVSADRVLVLTDSLEYHEWGVLGPALLLDLRTGARIAELRGERGAALSGGRFLLGLEGYDVFDTWLHDRDGSLVTAWRGFGHYVVGADDDVRVVECDRRQPTRSAVVRLLPGGAVERGHPLRHGQVAAPVVLPDGTVVVFDGGALVAVDRDLRGTVLAEVLDVGDESWRFTARLELRDDVLAVTVVERDRTTSTEYSTHQIVYRLRP
ncbi:hypothetical protein ACFFQW_31705 [Umezawaea endophytica]|uniref:Uncharacterized protein n=1 Tax=Umezawaea endophytica TaxID=1654476 RepID=A0A9X2VXI9_9PSEU|nr:hypothetical protein [Umezawaea endophytica]MCS7484012.1 hypothetical protein [Umezawaea endophytica]